MIILRVKNSKDNHNSVRFTFRSLIPMVPEKNPLMLPARKEEEEPFWNRAKLSDFLLSFCKWYDNIIKIRKIQQKLLNYWENKLAICKTKYRINITFLFISIEQLETEMRKIIFKILSKLVCKTPEYLIKELYIFIKEIK